MRNAESWAPSKIVFSPRLGRWISNPRYVQLGSRVMVDAMVERYQKLIADHARGRLLDCGCGDVPYFGIYGPLVDEVTCIDWGASEHGREHVDREVDLNRELPLADASFDTVLLADVLEHIAEPARLLSEIARVLSPSGKLVASVPFLYHVHEDPHDYYRYTRFALEKLCRDSGLESIEISAYGGYPDVLLDITSKGLSSVPPLGHLFVGVARRTARTALFRAWRNSTSHRFPLGYCLVARRG